MAVAVAGTTSDQKPRAQSCGLFDFEKYEYRIRNYEIVLVVKVTAFHQKSGVQSFGEYCEKNYEVVVTVTITALVQKPGIQSCGALLLEQCCLATALLYECYPAIGLFDECYLEIGLLDECCLAIGLFERCLPTGPLEEHHHSIGLLKGCHCHLSSSNKA